MKKLISIILALSVICVVQTVSVAKAECEISAQSYCVCEVSSGRVLYSRCMDDSMPIASLTKVMTAIVVLENCYPDDVVEIPNEAIVVEGSSIFLKADDKYTVRDLLYGLMLRSGNDSAVALAYHTAGNVSNFVSMMNDKAKDVGAYATHFVNPNGLHDVDHYSTARDMALISVYAMKNRLFKEIVSTKRFVASNGSIFYNKNKILTMYEGGIGIKTGYTKSAGRCLVSAACRDGMEVVTVVLNAPDMWNDSISLLNQAYREYRMTEIISREYTVDIDVNGGKSSYVKLRPNNSTTYPLRDGEKTKITYKNILSTSVNAPVYKGKNCGFVEIYLQKRLIFRENLYTIEEVKKKTVLDWLADLAETEVS